MSAPETTVAQVNFKTPEGTLINIYATSPFEAKELIDAMVTSTLPSILATEQAIRAGSVVGNGLPLAQPQPAVMPPAAPASPPSGGQVVQFPTQPAGDFQPPTDWQAQAAAQAAAPAAGHVCKHGYNAKFVPPGISKKTNKPYKGFYVCPLDQAQQCDFRLSVG